MRILLSVFLILAARGSFAIAASDDEVMTSAGDLSVESIVDNYNGYPYPNQPLPPGPFPGPNPGPYPGPNPGPYPGPNPGPYPGPYPGPNPGPYPGPAYPNHPHPGRPIYVCTYQGGSGYYYQGWGVTPNIANQYAQQYCYNNEYYCYYQGCFIRH